MHYDEKPICCLAALNNTLISISNDGSIYMWDLHEFEILGIRTINISGTPKSFTKLSDGKLALLMDNGCLGIFE